MQELIKSQLERFDKEFVRKVNPYWINSTQRELNAIGQDPDEIKTFLTYSMTLAYKAGAERREKELYLVADECEQTGWSFGRYLRTWITKMKQDGLLDEDEKVIECNLCGIEIQSLPEHNHVID